MEILEYSIISGYEVDSSIYYTGFDGLMYKKINVGEGVSIVISREDYGRLWDEAFKNTHMTMDDLRKNAQLPIATDDNGEEVIQGSESKFVVFDGRRYGGDITLYRQNSE